MIIVSIIVTREQNEYKINFYQAHHLAACNTLASKLDYFVLAKNAAFLHKPVLFYVSITMDFDSDSSGGEPLASEAVSAARKRRRRARAAAASSLDMDFGSGDDEDGDDHLEASGRTTAGRSSPASGEVLAKAGT